MTSQPSKTARKNVLFDVLGTLVSAALVFVGGWAIAPHLNKVPDGWRLPGVAAAILTLALIVSVFVPAVRKPTWSSWLGAVALNALRPEDRAAIWQQGYDAREQLLAEQRAAARSPLWRVTWDERNIDYFVLHNDGASVTSVRLSAPESHFVLYGQAGWEDFSQVGRTFTGTASPLGRENGITFTVSWLDQTGVQPSAQVFLPPVDPARAPSRQDEYDRGREDYRLELAKQRPSSPVQPRWEIMRAASQERTWILENHAKGSVINDVRLEVDASAFTLQSEAQWPEFTGRGEFIGRGTEMGAFLGLEFSVFWRDQNGDEQMSVVPAPAVGFGF